MCAGLYPSSSCERTHLLSKNSLLKMQGVMCLPVCLCLCTVPPHACMQVVQHLSGVDSADQDLFASLAMCLAAADPSTTPQQDLQELRWVFVCWLAEG